MASKAKLSAAVLGLVLAGASAPAILDQFLNEKEGSRLVAYQDGVGIWTICRGATQVDGKPVRQGMKLTQAECDQVNAKERDVALAWVDKNIHVSLTEPQRAGIASFCPYNIGPWWIKDGGKDCRVRSNNCFGQIERRDQESALACWGIDQ